MTDDAKLNAVISGLRANGDFHYTTVQSMQLLAWLEELKGWRKHDARVLPPTPDEIGLDDPNVALREEYDEAFGK